MSVQKRKYNGVYCTVHLPPHDACGNSGDTEPGA